MSHGTHILGGHNIYHHATNISQHHLQLGAHNICHHGKNINRYIQQIILLFYHVKQNIIARTSATVLSNKRITTY